MESQLVFWKGIDLLFRLPHSPLYYRLVMSRAYDGLFSDTTCKDEYGGKLATFKDKSPMVLSGLRHYLVAMNKKLAPFYEITDVWIGDKFTDYYSRYVSFNELVVTGKECVGLDMSQKRQVPGRVSMRGTVASLYADGCYMYHNFICETTAETLTTTRHITNNIPDQFTKPTKAPVTKAPVSTSPPIPGFRFRLAGLVYHVMGDVRLTPGDAESYCKRTYGGSLMTFQGKGRSVLSDYKMLQVLLGMELRGARFGIVDPFIGDRAHKWPPGYVLLEDLDKTGDMCVVLRLARDPRGFFHSKSCKEKRHFVCQGTAKKVTKAPAVVTKPSAVVTKAPVAVTKAPVAITKGPVAVTKAPVAVTKAPVAVTKAPVAVTKAPVAATKAPVAVTKAPVAVTKAPVAVTKAPVAVTKAPVAITKGPVAVTKAPVAVTKAPVAVTKAPVAVTKAPVAVTKAPVEKAPAKPALDLVSGVDRNFGKSGLLSVAKRQISEVKSLYREHWKAIFHGRSALGSNKIHRYTRKFHTCLKQFRKLKAQKTIDALRAKLSESKMADIVKLVNSLDRVYVAFYKQFKQLSNQVKAGKKASRRGRRAYPRTQSELYFALRGSDRDYVLVKEEVFPNYAISYCKGKFKGKLATMRGSTNRERFVFSRSLFAYMSSLGIGPDMKPALLGDRTLISKVKKLVDIEDVNPAKGMGHACIEANFRWKWLVGQLCSGQRYFLCEKPVEPKAKASATKQGGDVAFSLSGSKLWYKLVLSQSLDKAAAEKFCHSNYGGKLITLRDKTASVQTELFLHLTGLQKRSVTVSDVWTGTTSNQGYRYITFAELRQLAKTGADCVGMDVTQGGTVAALYAQSCSNRHNFICQADKAPPKNSKMHADTTVIPVTTKAIPVTTKAIPVTTKAIPVTTKVIPVTAKTIPATAKAKPVTAKAKPVTAKAKAVTAKVKLVTAKAKPVTAKAKAVTAKVKLVTAKAKPVTAKAKPVTAKVKPTTAKPATIKPSERMKHDPDFARKMLLALINLQITVVDNTLAGYKKQVTENKPLIGKHYNLHMGVHGYKLSELKVTSRRDAFKKALSSSKVSDMTRLVSDLDDRFMAILKSEDALQIMIANNKSSTKRNKRSSRYSHRSDDQENDDENDE